jgi:hypothetical protein
VVSFKEVIRMDLSINTESGGIMGFIGDKNIAFLIQPSLNLILKPLCLTLSALSSYCDEQPQ